ncbi:MAG TPA: hypothetical protein VFE14_19715 [Micromonosporaceae bacterium]|nr:hypothetical protein [Micromonosporaceae bacterium]
MRHAGRFEPDECEVGLGGQLDRPAGAVRRREPYAVGDAAPVHLPPQPAGPQGVYRADHHEEHVLWQALQGVDRDR